MNTHPDATAFVSRVLADPADAVIRTVFADWLHEQGGTANENWARYIRLRAQAAAVHGFERELLWEEADHLAPHIRARLTVPASAFAPHFHHFLDLLPPRRYTVALGDFEFPQEPNMVLGAVNARAARSLVLAERDGVFAVVSNLFVPGLPRVLGQRLNGRAVVFPTASAELTEAIERTFPPPPPTPSTTPTPDELNRKLARHTAERLVAEARGEHAARIEVLPFPAGHEVRFVVGGRAKRREVLAGVLGELVVREFFQPDAFRGLSVRARPRNTSFGAGVEADV